MFCLYLSTKLSLHMEVEFMKFMTIISEEPTLAPDFISSSMPPNDTNTENVTMGELLTSEGKAILCYYSEHDEQWIHIFCDCPVVVSKFSNFHHCSLFKEYCLIYFSLD